ncbi:572_t:CDS:2 [Rhizophagus irregularis]|nr:572_t:CDS:2 [Rhizophagus irregularis]
MNVSGSVREMEIQQLCGVQPVESSSNLETNKTCQSDLNANLQKLSRDLETQYSQDIPSLPSNICYVIEFTHEIITVNEVNQKARELAESQNRNTNILHWK